MALSQYQRKWGNLYILANFLITHIVPEPTIVLMKLNDIQKTKEQNNTGKIKYNKLKLHLCISSSSVPHHYCALFSKPVAFGQKQIDYTSGQSSLPHL